MEKELKIKITDPETGEFVVKTKKQSEIPDLVSKATERGLVLEQMPPEKEVLESIKQKQREEKVSDLSAFETGLLAGISVESQDEIRGLIFGDEAQKKAELEKPGAFGTGKRHREDGPAVELSDGTKEWNLHGEFCLSIILAFVLGVLLGKNC